MITINGVKFASSTRELVETLFHGPTTAAGTYQRHGTRGIKLFNLQGQWIGGINPHSVLYRTFKLTESGRYFHQCANPDGVPEWESYGVKMREIERLVAPE